MLQDRCEKCHNSEDWAGGVAFDTMSPKEIAADAETWEKAVRKLRGRLMPPPGRSSRTRRPSTRFVSWMEGQLDHAAAGKPAPGNVGLHRLNRTEYAREIDSMLGLDVDVKTLLPKDVSSDGFDNIAAVLRISPAFLDQYITAARNISRQAIGRVDREAEQPRVSRAAGCEPVRAHRRPAAGHARRHASSSTTSRPTASTSSTSASSSSAAPATSPRSTRSSTSS